MADKATTSSLLEAIKNKLNKFDSKTAPADKPPSNANPSNQNYFSADNSTNQLSSSQVLGSIESIMNDQAISSLDIDESLKKIGENINNEKLDLSSTQESDLDIDDESLNIKNISQQISIENKLKEIALDVKNPNNSIDIDNALNQQSSSPKSIDALSPNFDPIEQELLQLENEINFKKQQLQNNQQTPEIDDDLKNYLDSKFEPEINQINQQISISQPPIIDSKIDLQNPQENPPNIDKPIINSPQNSSNINNQIVDSKPQNIQENIITQPIENDSLGLDFLNNFGKKFSPASDYLAKILSNDEPTVNNKIETTQPSNVDTSNNIAPLEPISQSPDNLSSKEINNSSIENNPPIIESTIENASPPPLKSITNNQSDESNSPQEPNSTNVQSQSPIETSENNVKINENSFSTAIINSDNISQNPISSNQEPIATTSNENNNFIKEKSSDEIKKSINFERINYNLIREETSIQANNSIKKLVEAKQMIKSVNNFAHNDILNKIAVSLMEPKLEKWLNENLPDMVEGIVRQEIEKIVSKE